MDETVAIDGQTLTLAAVARFMRNPAIRVEIAPAAAERVRLSRMAVEKAIGAGKTIYGITTGFGRLADKKIGPDELRDLQRNLIRSHSAGVGGPLSPNETRLLMLLRANALAKGFSGVRLETL